MSYNPQLYMSDAFYLGWAKKVGQYYLERRQSECIPLTVIEPWGAAQYKYVKMGATQNHSVSLTLNPLVKPMETPVETGTADLAWTQTSASFPREERSLTRPDVLIAKDASEQRELAEQIDSMMFYGGFANDNDKVALIDGILAQATIVQDLQGTDSQIHAAGDWRLALENMLYSIPLKLRESLPITMVITENYWRRGNMEVFSYDGGLSERAIFKEDHIGPGAPKIDRIDNLIVTDKITCLATDTAAGEGAGVADTGGTTDNRVLVFVNDSQFITRVTSTGITFLGELPDGVGNLKQNYGFKGCAVVKDDTGVYLSEKITH